ncbi:MAG TPA: hypothetical protein VEQ58_01700 [Polyangiaceae bacterium]|nr:hypothetical protein [Polyangiaceae bacterium]
MTEDSVRRSREAQVESWIAEAKKLLEDGQETRALDLYRHAADDLPGAPWLQHRTAELSRKLKQRDVAIIYYRRAATAFQIAEFSKRAVAPLRTAWTLAVDGLPGSSKVLVELAGDLIHLQRRLGYAADATVSFERTNAALRSRGFSELGSHLLSTALREPRSSGPTSVRDAASASADEMAPPGSGLKSAESTDGARRPRFGRG